MQCVIKHCNVTTKSQGCFSSTKTAAIVSERRSRSSPWRCSLRQRAQTRPVLLRCCRPCYCEPCLLQRCISSEIEMHNTEWPRFPKAWRAAEWKPRRARGAWIQRQFAIDIDSSSSVVTQAFCWQSVGWLRRTPLPSAASLGTLSTACLLSQTRSSYTLAASHPQ